MGRCGGLKEGGHHRKAIDVAKKKKAEKAERAARKEAAGQRAAHLEKLLAIDPDCDIFISAAAGDDAQSSRSLCRSYFRYDSCTNRRCKFSHEHSIADAMVPGSAASRSDAEEEEGDPTMPPVELIPGLVNDRRALGAKERRRRGAAPPPVVGAAGSFEKMPVATVQSIVAYCEDDADVGNVIRSCRYLRQCLMDCRDVRHRKRTAMEARLTSRNDMLLIRATAERLRFAVSYANVNTTADTNNNATEKTRDKGKAGKGKGGKKGKNGRSTAMGRPTLAYDFENPHVFRNFQENARRERESRGLSSAFATNCRVQEP